MIVPVTDLTWYPFGLRTQAKSPPQSGGVNTVTSTRTVLHQYGYDAVGNRTSKLGPLGSRHNEAMSTRAGLSFG
jgi:YD repeat-containing protein